MADRHVNICICHQHNHAMLINEQQLCGQNGPTFKPDRRHLHLLPVLARPQPVRRSLQNAAFLQPWYPVRSVDSWHVAPQWCNPVCVCCCCCRCYLQVRLTFKPESQQLWIASSTTTQKREHTHFSPASSQDCHSPILVLAMFMFAVDCSCQCTLWGAVVSQP